MRPVSLFHRFLLLSPWLCGTIHGADLPAWIIDVPPSLRTILVADTGSATLYEYAIDQDGEVAVTEHYMSIGQRGVGKSRAGDQRTPLGNYVIVDQLDTSRMDPKYGATAFPLDYPNTLDRQAGRTGEGIWLHGVPPGGERRPERDTDGCLAIPNENLLDLAGRLELNATPVVVTRAMRYSTPTEKRAIRSELLARLGAWSNAIAAGDTITYLSLYAPEFRYRGLDRDEWAGFRAEQLAAEPVSKVELHEILILEDPEEAGLLMTRFQSIVTGDVDTAMLTKRLYWRRAADGRFLIVAEDNG